MREQEASAETMGTRDPARYDASLPSPHAQTIQIHSTNDSEPGEPDPITRIEDGLQCNNCDENQGQKASFSESQPAGNTNEVEKQEDSNKGILLITPTLALEEPKEEKEEGGGGVSGRDRLKRHRVEVAGRVWIPDIWGQEDFLKDWVDCSAFEASLVPGKIMSARAALAEEGRRANSGGLRIENRC